MVLCYCAIDCLSGRGHCFDGITVNCREECFLSTYLEQILAIIFKFFNSCLCRVSISSVHLQLTVNWITGAIAVVASAAAIADSTALCPRKKKMVVYCSTNKYNPIKACNSIRGGCLSFCYIVWADIWYFYCILSSASLRPAGPIRWLTVTLTNIT